MDKMTSISQNHTTANEVTRNMRFKSEKQELDKIAELRYKLTKAENETGELVAKHNKELSSCESQLAKLRSEVEKAEAVRQSLEYELAMARKQCSIEKMALQEEKENSFVKQELFKAQIEELHSKMHIIEENFHSTQFGWQEAQKKCESDLKVQSLQIENYKTQQIMLMSEKDSLEACMQNQNMIIQQLQQNLKELNIEKNGLLETVKSQKSKIALDLERDDQLKQDFEQRIWELKESSRVERVHHTKITSDLKSHLEKMENVYNTEKAGRNELSDKLLKLENEHFNVVKDLKEEIEKQNKMIADLSVKLKTSEESLAAMERDLEKNKKHQLSLEEKYGCNVRELQALVESFNTPSHHISGTYSDKDKAAGPAALEALRHTLTDYQYKLESTSYELKTKNRECTGMKEELESSKQMIHTLQKNLENIKSEHLVSKKELQTLSATCAERESEIAQLQTELVKIHDTREEEEMRVLESAREIQKITQTSQKDAEEKLTFMHGLYQRLVAGCVLLKEPECMMGNFSWPELCFILQENVDALISDLHKANEKVSHLEYALKNKADLLNEVRKKQEDLLKNLDQTMEDHQNTWHKKTRDLEQHYSVLLAEIKSRAQKYQRIAEKSKDKVSIYEKTKDQMALENVRIKNLLLNTEKDHKSLLAACALMAGALYPLYNRACALATQRGFLQNQVKTYVDVQSEIRHLVQALSDSEIKRLDDSKRRPKYSRCMKHVFRRGVIVVLAANRLLQLGRSTRTLFMWMEGINNGPGILVCGGVGQNSKTLGPPDEMIRYQEAWKWITSTDLLSTIITSMSDLLGIVNQKAPDSASQRQRLIDVTSNCFSKLMSKLNMGSANQQRYSIHMDPESLVHRLACGLHRIDSQTSTLDLTSTTPIMKCLAVLKKHILAFTQRLHTAEVERRSLRRALSDMKKKINENSRDTGGTENLPVHRQQFQKSKSVPYEKFRTVFDELNSALLREQEAQILLNEQSRQLQDLNHKIALHSQEEAEKDHTLAEAVTSLFETKVELRRKDQFLCQQTRRLTQLEQEKLRLEESISRAECALHAGAEKKEAPTIYVKSVAAEFQKAKLHTNALSISEFHSERSISEFLPLQPEPDFSHSHMNFSHLDSRTFKPSDFTPTTMQELPTKT